MQIQCSKNYLKISEKLELLQITQKNNKTHLKLKKENIKYLKRIFALPAIQCKW